MHTYTIELVGDHHADYSAFVSYEYEVQANNYEEALEKAIAQHEAKDGGDFHSTYAKCHTIAPNSLNDY